MSKLTGWWKNRSTAGKVELYTRGSFLLFVILEILSFGATPLAAAGSAAAERSSFAVPLALFLLMCAHAALCGVLTSKALHWVVGRRERPPGSRSPPPS